MLLLNVSERGNNASFVHDCKAGFTLGLVLSVSCRPVIVVWRAESENILKEKSTAEHESPDDEADADGTQDRAQRHDILAHSLANITAVVRLSQCPVGIRVHGATMLLARLRRKLRALGGLPPRSRRVADNLFSGSLSLWWSPTMATVPLGLGATMQVIFITSTKWQCRPYS